MLNSAATTATRKRIARTASAAVLAAAAIAAALALTFPTYSWGTSTSASEIEGAAAGTSASSPIKLVQLERSADGDSLEPLNLTDDYIMPAAEGVSTVESEGNRDSLWGVPTSDAFVDMIIGASCPLAADESNSTTEADETTDSGVASTASTASAADTTYYVRVLVAVPSMFERLDASGAAASGSPLHLVDGSSFKRAGAFNPSWNGMGSALLESSCSWSNLWTHEVDQSNPIDINGVTYNLHVYTYQSALAPGESTQLPAIAGFYLDPSVNYDHATGTLTVNGVSTDQPLIYGDGISIPVSAQCVATTSSNGTPYASAKAAFSAQNPTLNPWNNESFLKRFLEKLLKGLGLS